MESAPRTNRRGQVIALFALVLIVLVAICALTIDVGRLLVAKAHLQNAVDAAALAGAAHLAGIDVEAEKAVARSEAGALAFSNTVLGQPLTLAESDISFGHYDPDTRSFVPEAEAGIVDSIRVTGRRTHSSPDGPVLLFFGGVLGWDEVEIHDVVCVGTKPHRYVMFTLDRSGSMCFDTTGVTLYDTLIDNYDATGYYMSSSSSGWYWFPERAYRRDAFGNWYWQTAWFHARDNATGEVRTEFLPPHIQASLVSGTYFNFRSVDYPSDVTSGWIRVPDDVTIYGRYDYPWEYWWADNYRHVISSECGYATSGGQVQPLQSTVDAANAFVDLLRPGDDHAGLVTYAWKASTDSILTPDFDALKRSLDAFVPHGATAEPEGMDLALDELIDSGRADGFGQKIMILLTDGNANTLNGTYDGSETVRTYDFMGVSVTTKIPEFVGEAMETQTRRAAEHGVRIYCVTFGNNVDTEIHREIARATGGAYYYSANHESLPDVFVDIFRRLPPVITQ